MSAENTLCMRKNELSQRPNEHVKNISDVSNLKNAPESSEALNESRKIPRGKGSTNNYQCVHLKRVLLAKQIIHDLIHLTVNKNLYLSKLKDPSRLQFGTYQHALPTTHVTLSEWPPKWNLEPLLDPLHEWGDIGARSLLLMLETSPVMRGGSWPSGKGLQLAEQIHRIQPVEP